MLKGLRWAKRLRGTPFDLLGRTQVRRLDYEDVKLRHAAQYLAEVERQAEALGIALPFPGQLPHAPAAIALKKAA